MSLYRLPPHSPEAEEAVLSCVFQSPNDCLGLCVEKLASPDAFYDLRNRVIYATMTEMQEKLEPIDLVTIQQRLVDKQMLEQVGGIVHLGAIEDAVPSAANLSYYLGILADKFMFRRMIAVCTEAISRVYEYEGEAIALLDTVERDILKIGEARGDKGEESMKDLVRQAIDDIEQEHQNQGKLSGVETGFPDLDKLTGGLQRGEMIVIAARPSLGKTSLAANIVEHAAVDLGLPVGVFSLEMSSRSIVKRLLWSRARVNVRAARDGFLCERDFPKLAAAAAKFQSAPIYLNDTGGLPISQLRAKARRWRREHGVAILVVDYLQLVTAGPSGRKNDTREREVADISASLKNLAKELDIPVVVLSQLNREVEKRKGGRPIMADLRESGAIEQDADVIGFLYRPEKEAGSADSEDEYAVPVNLFIAKQRNGPTGIDVRLTFLKGFTRFESASKVIEDEAPEYKRPYNDP